MSLVMTLLVIRVLNRPLSYTDNIEFATQVVYPWMERRSADTYKDGVRWGRG